MFEDIIFFFQKCNSAEFVIVTKDIMERLMQASRKRAQLRELEEESGWDDGGEGFSSESDAYSEEGNAPPIVVKTHAKLESGVFVELCQTRKGATILVDIIPAGAITNIKKFYICENCGKCYWDGSHFERILGGRLRNVVS